MHKTNPLLCLLVADETEHFENRLYLSNLGEILAANFARVA